MRSGVTGPLAAGVLLAACSGGVGAAPGEGPPFATLVEGALTACVAPGPQLAEDAGTALAGYDVAVLGALADVFGLELSVVRTSYDEVVSGVALNDARCDVAAGGVIDGPTLAGVVTTTTAYRTVQRLVVATAPGPVVAPAEVQGAVGVEAGGPAESAAVRLPAAEVTTYPSRSDLGRALTQGLVDTAITTLPGRAALEDQLGVALHVRATLPTDDVTVLLLPLDAGAAVVTAVDGAIDILAAEGRLEELSGTWLDR